MYELISYIWQNSTHFASIASNVIAFDISTAIGVSLFGYSLDAKFAKAKVVKKASNGVLTKVGEGFKSVTRGSAIMGLFKKMTAFLSNNKVDILLAAAITFITIIFIRYTITHYWYNATKKTPIKKPIKGVKQLIKCQQKQK